MTDVTEATGTDTAADASAARRKPTPPAGFKGVKDVPTAGQELGLSKSAVYRLIEAGLITAIDHGGRMWIEDAEIADYWVRIRADGIQRRAANAKRARTGATTRRRAARGRGRSAAPVATAG